ncbi:MAG: hypothetical protein AB8E15_05925 [Bdellovibrionales bacterium]
MGKYLNLLLFSILLLNLACTPSDPVALEVGDELITKNELEQYNYVYKSIYAGITDVNLRTRIENAIKKRQLLDALDGSLHNEDLLDKEWDSILQKSTNSNLLRKLSEDVDKNGFDFDEIFLVPQLSEKYLRAYFKRTPSTQGSDRIILFDMIKKIFSQRASWDVSADRGPLVSNLVLKIDLSDLEKPVEVGDKVKKPESVELIYGNSAKFWKEQLWPELFENKVKPGSMAIRELDSPMHLLRFLKKESETVYVVKQIKVDKISFSKWLNQEMAKIPINRN